jgi:hypothetical protein
VIGADGVFSQAARDLRLSRNQAHIR